MNTQKNSKLATTPTAPGSAHKVYGKPLQGLYAGLLLNKQSPSQPELIRSLVDLLEKKGIHYHPRTIKRQLLGNIEYIPEALEAALLDWVKSHSQVVPKKLLQAYKKNKKVLENSSDQHLYVSPQFFTQMADGYLYLHKQLSRRQLALKLQEGLEQKNVTIGLETLQAGLAGKTQKIRKVIEDQLVEFYVSEGYPSKKHIENFLEKADREGKKEIEKVGVGNIAEVVDAYLLKAETLSKRQFAIQIKERLGKKGFLYHLSSIQSVIEGKTRKTKQAILETIYQMLQEEGIAEPEKAQEYLDSLPEAQRNWHHYEDAEHIPDQVQGILQQNPSMTRRQLALILRGDLTDKNFDFSLNTLQYILAGKTKRTRGIIVELLKEYAQPGSPDQLWALKKHQFSGKKGRPSLEVRVTQAHELLIQAGKEKREERYRNFLMAREELIKKRWAQKHPQKQRRPFSRSSRRGPSLDDMGPKDPYDNGSSLNEEPAVAYDVNTPLDRLVS